MRFDFTDKGIIDLAMRLIETWFLSVGLRPMDNFDPTDPACVKDYGPHRIVTCSATVPPMSWFASAEMLQVAFARYLAAYNSAVEHPEARFGMYSLKFYPGTHVRGTCYASIYQ